MDKPKANRLCYDSARGQCLVMLLAALEDLRGVVSKREAIDYIAQQHFFDVQDDDRLPYPSALNREPRWHCLIAWARKDGAIRGWVFDDERDSWGVTREGRNAFNNALISFHDKKWTPAECYLWTVGFKRRMCSGYAPAADEASRPLGLYRDLALQKFIAAYL
jgi:hypothetical protein